MTEKHTQLQYYVSKDETGDGRDQPPLGPLTKTQLSEALNRGFVGPNDKVWMPGMSGWSDAQIVFKDFFKSDQGKHIIAQHQKNISLFTSHSRPATLFDFCILLGLFLIMATSLFLLGLSAYFAIFFAPLGYWSVVAFFFEGQSFGMRHSGLVYVKKETLEPVSQTDLVLRGLLSWYLMLCFGLECSNAKRRDELLSDSLFGFKPKKIGERNLSLDQTQLGRDLSDFSRASSLPEITRTMLSSETIYGAIHSSKAEFKENAPEDTVPMRRNYRGSTRAS